MIEQRTVLVATDAEVVGGDAAGSDLRPARGLDGHRPTCLAPDPHEAARVWCGTRRGGVRVSDDGGRSWRPCGLDDAHVMALAASPSRRDLLWAGTEPSDVWRSEDGGRSWSPSPALHDLASAADWSFPPRPDTHHVRWIACHPADADRLWVAIEAGALVSSRDGAQTWHDRVDGGPYDTHELAVHPEEPERLRVAAGDGYYESLDGGERWTSPEQGLEVGYLRSVALDPGDPEVVLVSASSHAHSAYMAGRSDGRLYRRHGTGPFQRVTAGWPSTPETIAPLIRGSATGRLWAADERGVHASADGGVSWRLTCGFPRAPSHLRDLAIV